MKDEKRYIGCDVHRSYSVFRMMDEQGGLSGAVRVEHQGGELERFLKTLPSGSPVAVEACGGWMWMVGQIEAAGLEPHLAHPLAVKKRTAGRSNGCCWFSPVAA